MRGTAWTMPDPRTNNRVGHGVSAAETTLLVATGTLVLLGLLMVASASIPVSQSIYQQPGFLFLKQAIAGLVGLVALVVLMRVDYRRWMQYDALILMAALGLSSLTLIPGLAPNGLWLRLGPASFQPTEVAKLALIIALAAVLVRKRENGDLQSVTAGVLPTVALVAPFALIATLQPDFALVVLFGTMAGFMLWMAGARLRHLIGPIIAAMPVLFALLWTAPYRRERLLTFLNPLSNPQDEGYHLMQSFVALGSGGLAGRGLGASREKWLYLPSAYNDFIVSIVGEELGFLGVLFIILLLGAVVVCGVRIALHAPDSFGFLLASGLTFAIALQAAVNVGVAVGALPVTGLTLPLVSYGGTSLIVSMAMIGLLLSISRHSTAEGGSHDRLGRRRRDRRAPLSRTGHHRRAPTPLR